MKSLGVKMDKKDRLWTAQDVMEFFGIKKSTYYELLSRDQIPGKVMIGKQVRFVPELVYAGIKKNAI